MIPRQAVMRRCQVTHFRDEPNARAQRLGNDQDFDGDFQGGFVGQEQFGVDKREEEPVDRGFEGVAQLKRWQWLAAMKPIVQAEAAGSSEGAGANPFYSAFRTRGGEK